MEAKLLSGKRRLSLFPIQDNEVWSLYKQAQASFWTAEEIDLTDDLSSFKHMKQPEREFVKMVLAFFNSADILVNANISANFLEEDCFNTPEVQCFYFFQGMIEGVHSETYSLLIDTYFTDPKEKKDAFNAIETVPAIREKAKWVTKYMNNSIPLTRRLFGFALVEGLQFSGSFCAIFWLKKRNLCPGLGFSNELISRDEGMHTKFSCLMFKRETAKLDPKMRLTTKEAHAIVEECVQIEQRFVNNSLKISLIGMSSSLMNQYIRFVADVILEMCDFPPLYKVHNPFEWMETISLQAKSNFFERRVSEYAKSNVGSTVQEREFSMTEEF